MQTVSPHIVILTIPLPWPRDAKAMTHPHWMQNFNTVSQVTLFSVTYCETELTNTSDK
jgi:hypothetical protein